MEEPADTTLEETRRWFVEQSHRRFGNIPSEVIAEKLIEMTRGADFTVRRAALEALLRRMKNAEEEDLVVARAAPRGLGTYVVSRAAPGGRRGSRERRPYDVLIEGVAPIRGECGCPDFLKGSLGLCKHLLVVVDHVFAKPSRRDRALKQQQQGSVEGSASRLSWDPFLPLQGANDRLLGLRYEPARRGTALAGWMPGGAPRAADLVSAPRRVKFLQEALKRLTPARNGEAAIQGGPAVHALVAAELEIAEREAACARTSRTIARALRGLSRPLYPYQLEGVLRFLGSGRLLLADDMGLGKTTQAIAACHALYHSGTVERGLVIAPASLKSQWLREWHLTTDAPAQVIDGGREARAAAYRETERGFLIVNYELLFRDFDDLLPWAHQMVVVDEAQRIKNYATKSAAYVKALPAERRLVLTGTPLENRVEELASLLDWVDDRAMAPKWRLPAWHAIHEATAGQPRAGARNLETLRQRMSTCTLRRVRSEVLSQLPKRTDTSIPVEMTLAQADEHDGLSRPIASLISMAHRRPLTQAQFLRLMQLLTQQRMIANGLGQTRFDEIWPGLEGRKPTAALLSGLFSPKLGELRTLIEALVCDQGRKVVVFSQWRRMLKLGAWAVSDTLGEIGHRSLFFTGAESQRLRTKNLVDFHDDPKASVLFLSDAGGVGLNLQRAASACINIELPWNPAVLEQRIGRIYRLGQTKPIEVYNLVSQASIEERIAALVGAKSQLFKGLFDGTSDEIRFDEATSFISQVERLIAVRVPGPATPLEGATTDVDMAEEESTLAPNSDDVERPSGVVSAGTANDMLGALQGVRVARTPDGGLRIDASRESAAALSSVFDVFSRLLREAATGG